MNLIAWIADRRVGVLALTSAGGLYSFEYDPAWVTSPTAYPLSPALPLRPFEESAEQHSARVRRFLENLLPEGKALDDAASTNGLSKANLFGLMMALGRESAGAISMLPENESPASLPTSKRPVPLNELSERIRDRREVPFTVWDRKVRLSIAGLQDKLAVFQENNGDIALVEGTLSSTHILKPESLSDRIPHQVANEHYCLALANALGVTAATANIIRAPEAVLVVSRFDRELSGDRVLRRHIVDACQALDMPAANKYERNFGNSRDVLHVRDGVSFEKLFKLTAQTNSEAATRLALLRWAIFQYLIGNSDAHGKNISFFVGPGGLQIAPAYDLVAVCMYPHLDHHFAMAIGEDFVLDEIGALSWAIFASQCNLGIRLVARQMVLLAKGALKFAPLLRDQKHYSDEEKTFLSGLEKSIHFQATKLLQDAELLPTISKEHV